MKISRADIVFAVAIVMGAPLKLAGESSPESTNSHSSLQQTHAGVTSTRTSDAVDIVGADPEAGITVRVVTGPCWGGTPYEPGLFWGSELTKPDRVVVNIELFVHNQAVSFWLPFSAYADLGNPRSLEVQAMDGTLKIAILGGSTASDYVATMTAVYHPNVDAYVLTARRVFLKTFPDEVVQSSSYSWNTADR